MSLEILKKYNIKAKKSLWQNFLINKEILDSIVESVSLLWENIIEIWPWYGALTEKILEKKPKSLTLVELDREMIAILNRRIKNLELITHKIDFSIKEIDILKFEPDIRDYLVIANIPYYITSPILRHFLYNIQNKPKSMLILMQKDVWDKILWKKKNKSSVLSLFISKKCNIKEVLFVWKENFIPKPKVESSVLYFETHNLYDDINDKKFLGIIKKWFLSPRKKLLKNLTNSGYNINKLLRIFKELEFDKNIRWEDLNIDNWCNLVKRLENEK